MNRRIDPTLVITLLLLITGGLLMIYSASAPNQAAGNDLRYVTKQIIAILIGLALCWTTAIIPTRYFRAYSWQAVLMTSILLALCFTGFGVSVNGARRWLDLGFINLQPSAIAKIVAMVAVAANLQRFRAELHKISVILVCLYPAFAFMILIIPEPDFGTTAIITICSVMMLFIAGAPAKYFGAIIAGGVTLGIPIMLFESYRLRRILAYLSPWENESGDAYQIIQGWIAFHSGGFWGQGLGNGLSKRQFLPEPWTDYIGAVLAEEAGYIGFMMLIVLYMLLLWRGLHIAMRASDAFSTYLAAALTLMICGEAFLNLGVITGILPPKGLVLPFISYGSTSIICHLWAIGFLLSISAESHDTEKGWLPADPLNAPIGVEAK